MSNRTRNQLNRDKRNTTVVEVSGGVTAHALNNHTDTDLGTPGAPQDGWAVVWDETTGKYILEQISGLLSFYAAQGQNGTPAGDITLTAAASDDWLPVAFPTSAITDAAVCPLAFFTAGDDFFTIQRDGYHAFSLSGLWQTLSLTNATFQVGIRVNGALVYNHNELDTTGSAAESNAYIGGALEYYGLHKLLTGDIVELVFKRVGASYAEPVNVEELVFSIHTVDNYGNNSTSPHAWNSHVDTNLGTPGAGQDQHPTVWDNASGKYIISSLAMGDLVAHAFGQHSDANANLTAPGAPQDQMVVIWDNASSSYKLVTNTAVAAPHALNGHTDTNLGTPGAGQDTYTVAWNNASSKYVLQAPAAAAPHTLDSHSDVTAPAPTNGDLLSFDTGTSQWVNVTRASVLASYTIPALDNLSDVAGMGAKVNGSLVRWNSGAGKWGPATLTLDDMSDVVISGPTTGQGLVYNGSGWVNQAITAAAAAGAYCFTISGTTYASAGCTFSGGVSGGTFTAGSAGQWVLIAFTVSPAATVSITVGGTPWSLATNYGAVAAAYRSAGGTMEFTINVAGAGYNAIMFKIGT